jgi:hypothetical protein
VSGSLAVAKYNVRKFTLLVEVMMVTLQFIRPLALEHTGSGEVSD